MAVYTKISKKDISIINRQFEIEKIISFKGIKQGIENTNYLLRSKKKNLFLQFLKKEFLKKRYLFL